MKLSHSSLFVLFILLLVACTPAASTSKPTTNEVSFRPIEDIIEQPFQVTDFENDGSARLPIQTHSPVALHNRLWKDPPIRLVEFWTGHGGWCPCRPQPTAFGA
jgi:hypothetical protein